MRKNINSERIEGRLYQHDLSLKTVQNQQSQNYGKEFINGTIDVATDEEGCNVVSVHFTYVTATTKDGKPNQTYNVLKSIVDGAPTWLTHGKDEALKLRVNTSLGINDFLTKNDEMVSTPINEGGFVSVVKSLSDEKDRNTFTFDMLITNVSRKEADEKNPEELVTLRGAVFNFRNELLPVNLIVKSPEGMDYFENLGVTPNEPVYTKVWGNIVALTIKEERSEESAFGAPKIVSVNRIVKAWVVNGTATTPYEFGEEGVMTAEELKQAISDHQLHLAEVRKRTEEYRSQNSVPEKVTSMPINTGAFKF